MLRDKNIVLGVTGGIAAYKAAELCRALVREGAKVRVVMTAAAQQFVTPLTFQTLSQEPVVTDMFELWEKSRIGHIALADWADCLVIAPATANMIDKMAAGIADDMLSTLILAVKAPIVMCPAMNVNMYENRAVQGSLKKLRKEGVHVVEPGEGLLACGWEGKGRLPDIEDIVEEVEVALAAKDFAGKKVLVTSGPTREDIDPVRYISNRSSGKMGYALARAARRRGAEVVLVSGPASVPEPPGVRVVRVGSAQEMHRACLSEAKKADIILKAAAVSDYRPLRRRDQKIKKNKGGLVIELEKNPDILSDIGKIKGERILLGFAAETTGLVKNAKQKLREKNLDMIVANDVTKPGAGFDRDTNIVTIIGRDGKAEKLPQMTKIEVAERILDRIAGIRKTGLGGRGKKAK